MKGFVAVLFVALTSVVGIANAEACQPQRAFLDIIKYQQKVTGARDAWYVSTMAEQSNDGSEAMFKFARVGRNSSEVGYFVINKATCKLVRTSIDSAELLR